jgi:hypothetical protein
VSNFYELVQQMLTLLGVKTGKVWRGVCVFGSMYGSFSSTNTMIYSSPACSRKKHCLVHYKIHKTCSVESLFLFFLVIFHITVVMSFSVF